MEKKITLDEWLKMSEKDKGKNYRYLSDHEKFIVRTQHTPLGLGEVGEPSFEMTVEERRKKTEEAFSLLVKYGHLTQEQADKALAKK